MKLFAKLIGIIFNPVVILGSVPFFLIFRYSKSFEVAFFWTLISAVFLLFFSLFVVIGVKKKIFSDFDISNRKQRPLLYSVAFIVNVLYAIMLFLLNAPRVLFIVAFGFMMGLWITDIINTKLKVSIHIAALTGFVTFIVLIYGLLYIPLFLLIPLLAWARITTHNHTLIQTVVGFLMAFLLTLGIYIIFSYIPDYV